MIKVTYVNVNATLFTIDHTLLYLYVKDYKLQQKRCITAIYNKYIDKKIYKCNYSVLTTSTYVFVYRLKSLQI